MRRDENDDPLFLEIQERADLIRYLASMTTHGGPRP
jgi:hypothetical protein